MNGFCLVDDKHVPLYRIMWVSDVPHYCGGEDCTVEGRYEVRLEQGESVFANCEERDKALERLRDWQMGEPGQEDPGSDLGY